MGHVMDSFYIRFISVSSAKTPRTLWIFTKFYLRTGVVRFSLIFSLGSVDETTTRH
jgi:hypothetical protein